MTKKGLRFPHTISYRLTDEDFLKLRTYRTALQQVTSDKYHGDSLQKASGMSPEALCNPHRATQRKIKFPSKSLVQSRSEGVDPNAMGSQGRQGPFGGQPHWPGGGGGSNT